MEKLRKRLHHKLQHFNVDNHTDVRAVYVARCSSPSTFSHQPRGIYLLPFDVPAPLASAAIAAINQRCCDATLHPRGNLLLSGVQSPLPLLHLRLLRSIKENQSRVLRCDLQLTATACKLQACKPQAASCKLQSREHENTKRMHRASLRGVTSGTFDRMNMIDCDAGCLCTITVGRRQTEARSRDRSLTHSLPYFLTYLLPCCFVCAVTHFLHFPFVDTIMAVLTVLRCILIRYYRSFQT